MSARQIPHIGPTIQQRRLLNVHRASSLYELERLHKTDAALQVDAALARIRQSDASGCAECDDVESPTLRQWAKYVALSLFLTLGAYLIGTAVVP